MIFQEAAGEENLASTNKKRLINSSPRLSTKGRASKAPISPAKQATRVQTIKGKNVTQKGKKFSSDLVDKRRLTGKSLHMSIHFTSHAGESETSKITSPVVEKTRNSRSYTTMFNISMNKPASRQSTARVCTFLAIVFKKKKILYSSYSWVYLSALCTNMKHLTRVLFANLRHLLMGY